MELKYSVMPSYFTSKVIPDFQHLLYFFKILFYIFKVIIHNLLNKCKI